MRVKDVANTLAVSAETVRFYTRKGFLSPSRNSGNGYKEYGKNDLNRMRFILSARSLGFSVNDIGEIFAVADKKSTPCPLVRGLIEKRLYETEQQYRETQKLRHRMQSAVRSWNSLPDVEPTGDMICHLIENFTFSDKGVNHE